MNYLMGTNYTFQYKYTSNELLDGLVVGMDSFYTKNFCFNLQVSFSINTILTK
jgi:hypothetical protein